MHSSRSVGGGAGGRGGEAHRGAAAAGAAHARRHHGRIAVSGRGLRRDGGGGDEREGQHLQNAHRGCAAGGSSAAGAAVLCVLCVLCSCRHTGLMCWWVMRRYARGVS